MKRRLTLLVAFALCGLFTSAFAFTESVCAEQECASAPRFTPYTVAPKVLSSRSWYAALHRAARTHDVGTVGADGRVWIRVDERGAVRCVQLKSTTGDAALDATMIEAVRDLRFSPALDGDTPVSVWVNLPVAIPAGIEAGLAPAAGRVGGILVLLGIVSVAALVVVRSSRGNTA